MEQCRRVRDPPDHEKIRTIAARVRINCFSCPYQLLLVSVSLHGPAVTRPGGRSSSLRSPPRRSWRRAQAGEPGRLPPPPCRRRLAARSRNERLRLVSGFCCLLRLIASYCGRSPVQVSSLPQREPPTRLGLLQRPPEWAALARAARARGTPWTACQGPQRPAWSPNTKPAGLLQTWQSTDAGASGPVDETCG